MSSDRRNDPVSAHNRRYRKKKNRSIAIAVMVVLAIVGVEMQYYPQDYEVQMDHDCIDWGADLCSSVKK